jgi:hypothetical protein
MLLHKLPTKEDLFHKGIIINNLERKCILCNRENEDLEHVFFHCHVAKQVWQSILKWLHSSSILFENVSQHFTLFGDIFQGKLCNRFHHLIWLATTWSIWRTRNNTLFRGAQVNVTNLVDQIIFISWFWIIGRGCNVDLDFFAWCNNPIACFHCF